MEKEHKDKIREVLQKLEDVAGQTPHVVGQAVNYHLLPNGCYAVVTTHDMIDGVEVEVVTV